MATTSRKPKSLAEYAAEAQRKPFELPVDDKTTIVIQPPDVDGILDIEETMRTGTSREALQVIAGDQYEPLMDALHDQPAGVLQALLNDMRDWFGLGNSLP